MPRARVGSVWRHGDHFDVQVTLPSGRRAPRLHMPPEMSEAMARDKAAKWSIDPPPRLLGAVEPIAPPPSSSRGETADAWFSRYFTCQEARGYTSVEDNRGRWRKWCAGRLGRVAIRDVTRDDIEGLVEDLDACVRLGALSAKTAANVWGLVTKGFDDAHGAKARDLRVLEVNPAAGVRGPDRGVVKSKAYLYPSELLTLVSCEQVPVAWRRMYSVATYLYLRAAEARALEWADLDLDRGLVLVHRTEDDEGRLDSTKGMRARRFAIEPAILPLLRTMHEEVGGVGRVIPRMPVEKHLAPMLRRHLTAARVARADLFAADATRKRLRFHDLRASGLTWMACRGDDPLKIKQRAGHRSFSTTEGYIREAEAVRDGFGDVFPELPESLHSIAPRFGSNGHAYGMIKKTQSGRRDLNPRGDVENASKQGVSRASTGSAPTSLDELSTRVDVPESDSKAIRDDDRTMQIAEAILALETAAHYFVAAGDPRAEAVRRLLKR